MENQKQYNIFNIAAETIIKWFDQTHFTMTIALKNSSQLDVELMGILLAARKQTIGTLTTLANNHILPTHALLRMLVEILGVLLWAFNIPENGNISKNEAVHKRLRSWDLHRLKKDKAFLLDLPQNEEIKKAVYEANEKIKELKEQRLEEFPNYRDLFLSLGDKWLEVYAHYYRKYSRSVHIDRNITQKLTWLEEDNDKPMSILYKKDVDPEGYELLDIASISSDINRALRDFYGWQTKGMQKEYEELKLELTKK
jgi:hypothetical protein